MVGQLLSHYTIQEQIGAGGMGIVYRAHDEQLRRDVAIKVLPPHVLSDEAARKRFRKEALALARLNHPNVETVHEFGSEDGVDFLVTEYIPGLTLDVKLTRGALTEEEVLRMGVQLADGLQAAHHQGIVHRDLKPGNLRITPEDRVKILDFGLARLVLPAEQTDVTVSLSTSEQVPGTLPYMAPEQLRGNQGDERSDIYSAGAVLYEMIAGKRPFRETSGPQLIGAILEQTPSPPSSYNRRVSRALESIILKALDKDPNRRYQSARELHVDLVRISSGAVQVPPPFRRLWIWIAAAFLLVVALALGISLGGLGSGLLGRRSTNPAAKARRSVAVFGFKNLSGKADQAWLSTALAETLTTELAAGEQLRTIPGESVARTKIDLSLPDQESFGSQTLARIRKHLGSDLLVLGSYLALGKDSGGKIRIDFNLQDTVSGETIAAVSESGTEPELLDLVYRTGLRLREKLGVGAVSAEQASGVRASLPSNSEATRLYSEGLAKLRIFETLEARNLLEQAIAADPAHALAHSALAGAWSALGYDARARDEAKKAYDDSESLSREDRLWVEGHYREATHEWLKAVDIYRRLWGFFSDNLEYGLRLVAVQTSAGQAQDALTTIDELHKLPTPAGGDPRIDLAESKAKQSLGDFKGAQEAASHAAAKGRLQGARLLIAQARFLESWSLERVGRSSEAAAALNEAQELFSSAGDRKGAASSLVYSGNLLYDKGDFSGARKDYDDALTVFRQIGAQQSAASALNNIGNVLYDQGKLAEAEQYYGQVLRIYRDLSDKAGAAGALGNLANVRDGLGDLVGARKMQEECLQDFQDIGDKRGTASTLFNIGNLQAEMGDLRAARHKYEEALALGQAIGYKRGRAYSLFGLADTLTAQDELEQARKTAEESFALRKEMNEESNSAASRMQIALIALEQGKLAEAEPLARAAAEVFDRTKATENAASAYALLARALMLRSNLAAAQEAADHALALSRESGSRPARFEAVLASARVKTASDKAGEARKNLESVLTEATNFGYVPYELEARLALGEIDVRSGKTITARAYLENLRKDALARGFLLIARKAAAAAAKA
jgi:serine/threonine protein kinase/tetratricopeptide (TPR) repeat protein